MRVDLLLGQALGQVETALQAALLAELGCTLMQGYLYAQPLGWADAQSYRPPLEPSPA